MKKDISPFDIAKYYLNVELGKPFTKETSRKNLHTFISSLDEIELWNLLKLVSNDYRKNGIYNLLHRPQFTWQKEEININDIKLGEVNEKVKKYLEDAQYNPLKFKEILLRYSTTKELEEFRPRTVNINEDIFIFCYTDSKYRIVDGIHRLMSLVQQGVTTVQGYVYKL